MTSNTMSNDVRAMNQLKNKEKINDYLNRVEAMMHAASIVVRHESIDSNIKVTLSYIYTMRKLIFDARKINDEDFDALFNENIQSANADVVGNKTEEVKEISKNKPVFTLREAECAKQLTEGKSLPEVGENLNISERTVDFYLVNLIRKLNSLRRQ